MNPVCQFHVGGGDFPGQVAPGIKKLRAGNEPGSDDVFILQKYVGVAFVFKTRYPRFNCPDGIHVSFLKKGELIGIISWQDGYVAAGLGDFEALRFQPGAA